MNTIARVSVASALALGFGIAHASVKDPQSNGDVMLFAEVLNGSSVVGSYAGDSGVVIGSALTNGTVGTLSTTADSNLSKLLALVTGTNTLEWAVEGGNVTQDGVWNSTDKYVTTVSAGTAQLALRNGVNTTNWSSGLSATNTIIYNTVGTANSIFATSTAAGGQFDVSAQSNIANWYANGTATAQTGYGSTALYSVGMGAKQTDLVQLAGLGNVTLSSSGLSFAAGGGTTAVPLPAAIWLLGSGLLGLFGVGRRKTAVT